MRRGVGARKACCGAPDKQREMVHGQQGSGIPLLPSHPPKVRNIPGVVTRREDTVRSVPVHVRLHFIHLLCRVTDLGRSHCAVPMIPVHHCKYIAHFISFSYQNLLR